MNIEQLLQSLAERVSASASVRNVCGDPVVVGNRTVIPIAQVRYGFGGGGGSKGEQESGGGGGGVSARLSGVLEITPEGTRFIKFDDHRTACVALALGFVLGAAVVALRGAPGARQRESVRCACATVAAVALHRLTDVSGRVVKEILA
jgi:uncharacterized spore protein YtfJ